VHRARAGDDPVIWLSRPAFRRRSHPNRAQHQRSRCTAIAATGALSVTWALTLIWRDRSERRSGRRHAAGPSRGAALIILTRPKRLVAAILCRYRTGFARSESLEAGSMAVSAFTPDMIIPGDDNPLLRGFESIDQLPTVGSFGPCAARVDPE